MRYTGHKTTRSVTFTVPFLDEPVRITNMNDLPPGIHFKLANPETIPEALETTLPDDLAHILLYQGTYNDLETFMNTWISESEKATHTHKHQSPTTLDDILSRIINGRD